MTSCCFSQKFSLKKYEFVKFSKKDIKDKITNKNLVLVICKQTLTLATTYLREIFVYESWDSIMPKVILDLKQQQQLDTDIHFMTQEEVEFTLFLNKL